MSCHSASVRSEVYRIRSVLRECIYIVQTKIADFIDAFWVFKQALRPVLSHIDLDIPDGKLIAIMGPNGVGNSTLLGIIAGLISPAKGHVEINGLRRRASEESELKIRRQMAFLPDHPWLPEFLTAREWLLAVGELYDIEADHLMDHICRLLD